MTSYKKLSIAAVILAALAIGLLAFKNMRPQTYMIGFVNNNPGLEQVVGGFKEGMERHGYVEGKNVRYVYDGVLKDAARIDAALKGLIAEKADVIVTIATPVTSRAKELTEGTTIPVVFAPVFLAVESGLVESLPRPGGNLTGIQVGGNTQKALEWHKTAFPGTRLVFVPYTTESPVSIQSLGELVNAAPKLGVELILAEAGSPDGLKAALENIPGNADSIWLLNSHFFIENAGLFAEAALRRKLPLSSGTSQLRHGFILSYAQKPERTGEQAGRLASQILGGIPPSELPVETCEYFLRINLRTAAAIGVEIPDAILRQADEIIR